MKKLTVATWIATAALMGASAVAQAGVVVIVHPSSKVDKLTADDVNRIFLGKTSDLPNGEKALPVDQNSGTGSRDKFTSQVIQKTDSQLKSYWSRIIFTGKGQPPKEAGDDAAVKDLVSKNPSIIGYIDEKLADASVKVVLQIP